MTTKLTYEQKSALKNLMDDYFSNKSKFIYDGTFRRESYAYPKTISTLDSNSNIAGCMYKGKYILNCGLFAQMIWMGRSIEDFAATPKNEINTDFDWGYYFDFQAAQAAYGVMKNSSTYYSSNTYENAASGKSFITFDNAAAMAQELYVKGCEIPYAEADIGDLVFYRSDNISDGDTDALEQTSFRYITHVGIVYNKANDGTLTMMECSSAFAACLGKSGLGTDVTKFGNVRAANAAQRIVMVGRHPVAAGRAGNVPEKFNRYRGVRWNG